VLSVKRVTMLLALAAFVAAGASVATAKKPSCGFKTDKKPYLVGVPGTGFTTEPLLTVGETVPVTGSPGERYQMVGIPDGLGAVRGRPGVTRVFMNHELNQSTESRPYADRAAFQRGAFISEYRLARDGSVLSGQRAFDTVYQDDTLVGPAAETTNSTPAFSRFCSGFMAGRKTGFDRPIYLTGEETASGATFNPAGGQTVAVFDREIHALKDFGYFARENTVVAPGTGKRTVAFALEDGPQTPDSQLYMYVGKKQKNGTVLQRNGLVGGDLWVFASDDPANNSEATFNNGTLDGHWVKLADATNAADQEAKADAAGAFAFVRIEDGAFGQSKKRFNFVTTGESADQTINRLGANYRLRFDPNKDPEDQNPKLSVVYNADQIDAANQDGPFSPDNLDTLHSLQAIQEDGTTPSRLEMGARNRDGSIWLVDGSFTSDTPTSFPPRTRIAELTGSTGGQLDPTPRYPGIWESSGIIDAKRFFTGRRLVFLLDVQAHESVPPRPAETVEDGQLLLLRGERRPN
jgi:Bacterial protein of unknown function (DUF839)